MEIIATENNRSVTVFQPGDTHVSRRVHAGHPGVRVQGTSREIAEGGIAVRH